ncbi:MAG: cytidine deaminase [Firmicutes bacterium HGW-Firmicutes-12]|jgi:cytidine deaminase|nr:MAG: cytidine deaminase [Firmicutes bacterium HGW-Firmicutes-12]
MLNDKLIDVAREVRERAYAPYSGFKVGAAIMAEDGTIYSGCNIENASYSHSICAERVALFKAVGVGARIFQAIAIVTELDNPASPCGACRQVLAEFSPDMQVLMANTRGKVITSTVKELLPMAFSNSDLREDKF